MLNVVKNEPRFSDKKPSLRSLAFAFLIMWPGVVNDTCYVHGREA